ncbi:BadF/BadG/BcrA/BcrD ATPase family protein [Aliiroseovarius subalbicans]|uniref:BadF/BadG/BcrA/BcrD ATPase family protein n=1 Tax=Aliiroseovarius subalbicans TaxID=2925840 RepID=UPI001F5A3DD1|nr:BadF/BadG/BcrA/BcrD ATPase family protein [Aliiroseovarius subalbicans]MCI2397776.1 ATPase [Aliiroseovarius subalbicans]
MRDSNTYDAIGVDGGGTSCRIAVVLGGARASLKTGRANVNSDFSGAVETICAGVNSLADQLEVAPRTLFALPAYLGLAGVLDDAVAARVAKALPFDTAQVDEDPIPTLTGALDGADGAVAGIGTGSFLARRIGDETRLIGGHGFRVGDEASGAWLGRGALIRTLHVVDGLYPATPLTDAILDQLGGSAAGIVAFATRATPEDFGTFAPRVVAAANEGDAAGLDLMERGARYIEDGLRAVGWTPDTPLCLTGGVGPHYAPFLGDDTRAAVVPPKGSGLDGAVMLAQRLAASQARHAP